MKKYISPLIEMITLDKNDVVRTSNGYFENELPMVPFSEGEKSVDFQ